MSGQPDPNAQSGMPAGSKSGGSEKDLPLFCAPQEAPSPSPAKTAPPPEAGELVTTFIDSGEQAVISLPEKPPAPPDQGTAVVLEDVKKPLPPIVGGRVVADVKDEAGRLIARSGDRVTEGMIRQAQQAGRVVALTASVVMDG